METQLQQLIEHWPEEALSYRRVGAGEMLFRQGQPANAIYAIRSGSIRMERDLEDGSTVVLHTARAGETFAEAAFNASHYHCNAVAVSDSDVLVLASKVLNGETADLALHKLLNTILANQVRELRTLVSLRDIRGAEDRLLAWIQLQPQTRAGEIVISQTWTVIAQAIGLTRESVYRALSNLVRKRVIERSTAQSDDRTERLRLL